MTGYFNAGPRQLQPGDSEAVRALVWAALGVTPYVDRVAELLDAARGVAELYASVTEATRGRRGLRSNGDEFTVESLGRYHLHDVVHHLHDVAAPA